MPNLIRITSAAAAAACLALAVPAAASAATAGPAPHAAPASSGCSSAASIGWVQPNSVYGGGWITCPRPFPSVTRTVDSTLYLNGVAVAYGRSDCNGLGEVCSVSSPAVANPPGIQTWCSYSTATYDSLYNVTSHECWNG
jgi:hypothetical protein